MNILHVRVKTARCRFGPYQAIKLGGPSHLRHLLTTWAGINGPHWILQEMAIQEGSEKKTPSLRPLLITYKETDVKGPPDRSSSPAARGLQPLVVFAAPPPPSPPRRPRRSTFQSLAVSLAALAFALHFSNPQPNHHHRHRLPPLPLVNPSPHHAGRLTTVSSHSHPLLPGRACRRRRRPPRCRLPAYSGCSCCSSR